ncbi:hypothetical protein [Streptomyces swartbergensis]|uniref:hypothetical protein n=1 Tax=Streptomyces swartbergensis TaxID=487165 RepID=UPI003803FD35
MTTGGKTYFYLTDAMGSVVALTDTIQHRPLHPAHPLLMDTLGKVGDAIDAGGFAGQLATGLQGGCRNGDQLRRGQGVHGRLHIPDGRSRNDPLRGREMAAREATEAAR